MAGTAAGRVFTVPAEGAEAALRAAAGRGARYDAVLSFMCTPRVTSLEDYIAGIEEVLSTDGWIGMVEPAGTDHGSLPVRLAARLRHRLPPPRTRDRDVVSAVRRTDHGSLPVRLAARLRHRLPPPRTRGRDVVSAVRAQGLVVTDVQRREARSVPPAWRRYVVLRARRVTPQPDGL